jgi:hypothetical protein
MIKRITRPYNNKEKELIQSQKPSITKTIEEHFFLYLIVLFAFLIPFLIVNNFLKLSSVFELIVCVIILILSVFITIWAKDTIRKKYGNNNNSYDTENCFVEVIEVHTTRAVKRKDSEDFGIAFYLEVLDNNTQKTLFLWGQYLDILEDEEKFPNSHFEIIKRMDTNEIIDLIVKGDYFKPEKTLKAFSESEWKSESCPYDGEILEQKLDAITELFI